MSTKVLAIDCGLRMTGVALAEGEGADARIIQSSVLDLGRRQAAELPLVTEKILKSAELSWENLDLIAVTNGPGYFTGLRVGAAYATGLAFALGLKVVPVCSLEMLARSWNMTPEDKLHLLPLVYASHTSVYAASYFVSCGESELDASLDVGEYTGAALGEWLDRPENAKTIMISNDPERAVAAMDVAKFKFAGTERVYQVTPNAESAALIALERKGQAIAPEALRLTYCRSAI